MPQQATKKMNPGQRLLKAYDALVEQSKDRPMTVTWAPAFRLDPGSPTLEDEVTSCLLALRDEMDFAKELLVSKYQVPAELLEPGFSAFRDASSLGRIHQTWHSLRGNVTPPQNRHAFTWMAWVLRDETEEDMTEESMQGLRAEVESLEAALRDTAMSDYLRAFTQRQVTAIRTALKLYEVQGVRPVNDAIEKVAGAFTLAKGQLQAEVDKSEPAAKEALSKAAQLVEKVAKACDNLEKIKKAGETIGTIAGGVKVLVLPYFS
jgi:hypothetical protein